MRHPLVARIVAPTKSHGNQQTISRCNTPAAGTTCPDATRCAAGRGRPRRGGAVVLPFVGVDGGRTDPQSRLPRNRDYATNVLSFPYETDPAVQGDLVICPAVVAGRQPSRKKDRRRPTTPTWWCMVCSTCRAGTTTTTTMPPKWKPEETDSCRSGLPGPLPRRLTGSGAKVAPQPFGPRPVSMKMDPSPSSQNPDS